MNRFQILEWDSNFFGITVARILPDRLTRGELEQTLDVMKKSDVGLAYWASNPDDDESQFAAKIGNGFLADKKVTFTVNLDQFKEPVAILGWEIEEYLDAVPDDDLEALAIQAGIYSRYSIDARMPAGKFLELYKLWILNSVKRQIADAVLVVRHSGKIVGMVTVGEKNGRSDIGLIAVDASMRGKNLGVSLVYAATEWGRRKGFTIAQVVTQGENSAACKLYEKCGYAIDKTEYFYHFWL